MELTIKLTDVLDTMQGDKHIVREVLDTLALRKKITEGDWLDYCMYYNC